MNFKNKVVIVTGASAGIGAVIATEFASKSAKLVLVGRNKDNLVKTAEKCRSFHNIEPLVVPADLKVVADIERIVKETIANYNQIDAVINNAAAIEMQKFENATMEHFERVMSTNVRAVYYLTQLSMPYLIASKGNVVNISSIAATTALPGFSIYSTSKAALDQLTRVMALEMGPKGVRLNVVTPGQTLTNSNIEKLPPQAIEKVQQMTKMIPLRKIGTGEDIAAMVVFVASDAAKSVTGANFVVDNGGSMVSFSTT